jgi:hypothetical protein
LLCSERADGTNIEWENPVRRDSYNTVDGRF